MPWFRVSATIHNDVDTDIEAADQEDAEAISADLRASEFSIIDTTIEIRSVEPRP